MIRLAVLAAAAVLSASAAAAADTAEPGPEGPACLAYGDAATFLRGTVYAIESFDEGEPDTVERERHADFYALVMTERICVGDAAGDPQQGPAYVTVVRLDMPREMAGMVVQKPVLVQGALSFNAGPDADPAVVMKVTGLAAQ